MTADFDNSGKLNRGLFLKVKSREKMEPDKPSATALAVSMQRAAHLILDGEPKIFEDQFALPFIGQQSESSFKSLQTPEAKFTRSCILCRSRYAEDLLYKAISRGVKQYVILGAGLDSFAYQNKNLSDKLRIFEVDHPASQEWKRKRIEEAGISLPENVCFVPIDFELQSLEEGMAQGGYIPDDPTFFSWLGVTYYLTEDAVFNTLQYVATSAAPDSEIVFEYVLPDSMLSEEVLAMFKNSRHVFGGFGEPWISTFSPDYMASKLNEIGFDLIEEIDRKKVNAYNQKYFLKRTDGLLPTFEIIGMPLIRARIQRNVT